VQGVPHFRIALLIEEIKKANELFAAIKSITADEKQFASAETWLGLPFPFIGAIPSDRFPPTVKRMFRYMGREKFIELRKTFAWLSVDGYRKMFLFGTMGYGKSYILAALVCFLLRSDRRVVFLPDCKAMVIDRLDYLKKALLLALHDDKDAQDEIATLQDDDSVVRFCKAHKDLIFVVDQYNGFDYDPEDDPIQTNLKGEAKQLVDRAASETVILKAASANNHTSREDQAKQTHTLKLKWLGGFSEVWLV
jgi:hypothetical protein